MYDTEKYNNVNVEGTKKLIEILENENHQIQKILIASSRAIYGEGKYFCKKHGITYPEKRKEYDLKKGKFNSICEKCNIELQLLQLMKNLKYILYHIMGKLNISKKN